MTPVAFHVGGDTALSHGAMLYPADRSARRSTLLVLAHGAGQGQSSPWMTRYARGLAERGLDVVTFDFPYMQAGRRAPDRAPILEDAFRRVITAAAAHRHVDASRLVIGGKSMGGRMATHLAAAPEAWPTGAPPLTAVVVFGYPLNPPGGSKASPDRVSHLLTIKVPTLIVQGTRDTFGGPETIRRALANRGSKTTIAIHAIEGGDHSLTVRRKDASGDESIWDAVARWIGDQ